MAKTKKKNPAKQATEDKAKKKKSKSGLDEYFGALFGDNMQQKGAAGGPIPKNKPKKAPPGTKIGPGRKDKKGVPHGVDDDTIYLKDGGSASKFGMLSVKAGIDNNPNPTQADRIAGATKKMKRGGPVDTPKKKRGNYGPNKGKPFKAMGPVGGLPVNKAGTKIMSNLAGRLAKRGYGKARK